MAKKPTPSPATDHALRDHQPGQGRIASTERRGNGDELHQEVGDEVADAAGYLTDNFGHRISDNQNSLRAGERGPTLLEDFVLREKIFHFDHERIPERIVHARGSGAHGVFECTKAIPALTKASILQKAGATCPVFVRFSTVAGGAGSVDTPRDVRGFAVKLYTDSGNWDLVGNNIPVFFIQDAMKFPDLVHAVKMEADRGYPQAASAHDTFWDFIGLMPEAMHMIMWAMSDRTIPRSLRMIEGFGVHTFRFVNEKGEGKFVKFHWKPVLGIQSTTWDEAVKIAGADPDSIAETCSRRSMPATSRPGISAFRCSTRGSPKKQPYDVLDATKLIPEEDIPVEIVGRMTLNRNVDNFFAETEQVAFLPSNIIPGIDFSNDPLLQGRLFSYLDTQKIAARHDQFPPDSDQRSQMPVPQFSARRDDADARSYRARQLRAQQSCRGGREWRTARERRDGLHDICDQRRAQRSRAEAARSRRAFRRPFQPGATLLLVANRE